MSNTGRAGAAVLAYPAVKTAATVALAIGAGIETVMQGGCARVGWKDTEPNYPPLPSDKVQFPDEGCLIGFHQPLTHPLVMRWAAPGYTRGDDVRRALDRYEKELGQKPAIFAIRDGVRIWSDFPMDEAVGAASRGVIPHIYAATGDVRLEDIVGGKYDKGIRKFAEGALRYGEKYGGFLLKTMREMNDPSTKLRAWKGKSPSLTRKTWNHIVEVVGENGANDVATWVWSVITQESTRNMRDPERFYPGDESVDCIGLSCYSAPWNNYSSFRSITSQTYLRMRKKHKQKRILQVESGMKMGPQQDEWMDNTLDPK